MALFTDAFNNTTVTITDRWASELNSQYQHGGCGMIGQQERTKCDRCGRELMATPSGTSQCPDPQCRDTAPDAGELIEPPREPTRDERARPCTVVMYGSGNKAVPHDDLNPLKAIRLKCVDCSGGSFHEVKECVIPECPLYTFRLGKNPNRKQRKLTDEQRAELASRLQRRRPR